MRRSGVILFLLILSLIGFAPLQSKPVKKLKPRNPGPISTRSIEIIRRSSGVFIYRYPDVIGLKNPHRDYLSIRRVTDHNIIMSFRKLLAKNAIYQPRYKKRCMPIWDYGIEFREKKESRTFLFSFRCNTMKIVEEKIYRDFKRERIQFYTLFKYEINDISSEKVLKK